MKNAMAYKGYTARIDYDPRDNIFVGRVLGIGESITFHGATVEELHADLQAAIEHYLEDCQREGRTPQQPASGRLMLRLPPEVHAAALRVASGSGKSLNQWAAEVLSRATS